MTPEATYMEDEYHFLYRDEGILIVVERFRERDGDLIADVHPESADGTGYLPSEKVNLSSARSMKIYANTLAERPLQGQVDWFALITRAADLTKQRYREGAPAVVLADVEWAGAERFILPPWVDAHGTTILFGDGGTSKSVHALAIAISVATGHPLVGDSPAIRGPVVYADWEADEVTHGERMAALCAAAELNPPRDVFYMERSASISESARELRKTVATHRAVLLIVDSLGAAGGTDPEKADTIIRSMNAIRSIGVPTLALSHVTKDQRDKTKPFGSVYAHNLARRTVRIDGEQDEGNDEIAVRLSMMKANFGRLERARGHKVVFQNDKHGRSEEIRFEHASWSDLPNASQTAGMKYDLAAALRDSKKPMTLDQLVEITGYKRDTIYKTLRRNADWFAQGDLGWTLISSDTDTEDVRTDMSVTHGRTKRVPSTAVRVRGEEGQEDDLSEEVEF